MTPERWARISALFNDVLEAPAEARAARLEAGSGGDAELRAEVEALLTSERRAGTFLEHPRSEALPALGPGARLGAWRLDRQLGEGGMGVVWLASRADGAYAQQVALKVMRGGLDGAVLAQQLSSERQILASLTHPGIARLLDGGAGPDGTPFLAMEYVAGRPIDAYCREAGLGVDARLALVHEVCGAVSHAHQRLVVHRDLKPANILVTAAGKPVLLDFGIARLLTPGAEAATGTLTRLGLSPLTPAYASPEQLRGEPVTTASDVFSLGVVLYELVAGRRPFGPPGGAREAMTRAVLDEEPPPPSAAGGPWPLDRDLDSVVLKALEKDPARRYPGADALAADLRRWRAGEPVQSRSASLTHRAWKLARRHRALVGAAAALVLSLGIGLGASLWQAREASRARARADERLTALIGFANSMLFEVYEAVAYVPGATDARVRLTTTAVRYLDAVAAEGSPDPALVRGLAAGYQRVAEVQDHGIAANLGDTAGARRNFARALALLEPQAAAPAASDADRLALAGVRTSFAVQLLEHGEVSRALELNRQALDARQALLAAAPQVAALRRAVAAALSHLGDALAEAGDDAAALRSYREMGELYGPLVAEDPASARNRWGLICSDINGAEVLRRLGDRQGARAGMARALERTRALEVDRPDHYTVLSAFGLIQHTLGELAEEEGRLGEARAALVEALQRREALVARDPQDLEAALEAAQSRTSLGRLDLLRGDAAAGGAALARARGALEALAAAHPTRTRVIRALVENALALAPAEAGGGCARLEAVRARVKQQEEAHPELGSLRSSARRLAEALGRCPAR